ncbi:MAG: cytochrome c maturation protein CcmE [Pseudomonadales bacterium]|nr:cytochrome c maturation protein CcmE [Pseudomonadales bacterium]
MNPKRKQRLTIVLGIFVAVGAATGLITFALSENINLFYTPTQIANGEAPEGRRIRVGGLVVESSVNRAEGLKVAFDLTDKAEVITVKYEGILPDLFREGQGIIAMGKLQKEGWVEADEVLAKHDENYVAPEVQEALEKAGHPVKQPAKAY